MSLNISQYTDPGVYVGEVVVPGSVSTSTVPLAVCLIGVGNRNKRVSNEAVVRGLVQNETLTVAATNGAHDATLVNYANRKLSQMTIYKDGVPIDNSYISINQPQIVGQTLTTVVLNASSKLAFSIDGRQAIVVSFALDATDYVTSNGNLYTHWSVTDNPNSMTAATLANGINQCFAAATALGYGPAYGSVASAVANQLIITSPSTSSIADVKLLSPYPAADDKMTAVFGAAAVSLSRAKTVVRLADSVYSSTSTYKASYVSVNTDLDTLANTSIQKITRVGSYAGVTSFKKDTDFAFSSSNLDWSIDSAAQFTSSIASATFSLSPNDTILIGLDGKAAISIDLNLMASPPPGYVNPASAAAATPSEIANNINAVLANSPTYGPKYSAVASVSGSGSASKLVLTSPTEGAGSIIELGAPTLNSAVTSLFGLASTQLPYSKYGVGSRPAAGAIYFASYDYTRPTSDYNKPKRFLTPDSAYADVGQPSSTNQLAIGTGICFDNKAPSVVLIQVNDANFPGSPTQSEIKAALDAAGTTSTPTEICVLDTRLGVQVDMIDHVASQCSPTQKNMRRGWFGMPIGTSIGDKDTVDSYIYRAVRTLQVPGDSPARGRLVLVAPTGVTRNITTEDGSSVDMVLDGSYLAAAVAAKMTSFTSPADTLLRKTISGFKIDNFPTFLKAERALLASNGVTVTTLDAGKLVLTDPVSTEAGGGKLVSFQEISASTQKDGVTAAITQAIDANLVGVVPTDLSTFILTIKGFIAGSLNSLIATGAIGPFKTEEGVTRDVDMASDIQVFQDKSDATKFSFRYFFNLRLPAKRFFGEYSVGNPFFSP